MTFMVFEKDKYTMIPKGSRCFFFFTQEGRHSQGCMVYWEGR